MIHSYWINTKRFNEVSLFSCTTDKILYLTLTLTSSITLRTCIMSNTLDISPSILHQNNYFDKKLKSRSKYNSWIQKRRKFLEKETFHFNESDTIL